MPRYKLYAMDQDFQVQSAHNLECENDDVACNHAEAVYPDTPWELWNGREVIRRHRRYHH